MKNIPIRLYRLIDMGRYQVNERIESNSYEEIKLYNLDKLLKRLNNDVERLAEFPNEFFTCNTELLNNMLAQYNINISKNIFITLCIIYLMFCPCLRIYLTFAYF